MDVNSTSPNVDTPALLTTAHRPGKHTGVTSDTNRRSACARTQNFIHPFPNLRASVSHNPRPGSPARRCTRPAGPHSCDPSESPPVLWHLLRRHPAKTTGAVRVEPKGKAGGLRGPCTFRRHPAKTVKPSLCRCFASARPNPLSQPVTNTALPCT